MQLSCCRCVIPQSDNPKLTHKGIQKSLKRSQNFSKLACRRVIAREMNHLQETGGTAGRHTTINRLTGTGDDSCSPVCRQKTWPANMQTLYTSHSQG